jgi:hypothetical protein
VNTPSATPNAKLAIGPAERPSSRRSRFATAGPPTDAADLSAGAMPSLNCSLYKPNMLPGPMPGLVQTKVTLNRVDEAGSGW